MRALAHLDDDLLQVIQLRKVVLGPVRQVEVLGGDLVQGRSETGIENWAREEGFLKLVIRGEIW